MRIARESDDEKDTSRQSSSSSREHAVETESRWRTMILLAECLVNQDRMDEAKPILQEAHEAIQAALEKSAHPRLQGLAARAAALLKRTKPTQSE